MNTTYQAAASTIGFKLGASGPKAELAGNPNIIQTKQEYSRSPLAANLSKAGMLQRASDYMRRSLHPEENKDEPLQKDPETLNPFLAENKRNIESLFHQTYDAIKSFRTNSSGNKYNPASNEKKQKKPYDAPYDIYNAVQYRPEGESKKKKSKITSLVEKLEKKAEQYLSKFYKPHNKDTDNSRELYEDKNMVKYGVEAMTNFRPYILAVDYTSGSGGTHNPQANRNLFGSSTLEERVGLLMH